MPFEHEMEPEGKKRSKWFEWDNKITPRDIALVLSVLGSGVVALMMLNTTVAVQANTLANLQTQVNKLEMNLERTVERIDRKLDDIITRYLMPR